MVPGTSKPWGTGPPDGITNRPSRNWAPVFRKMETWGGFEAQYTPFTLGAAIIFYILRGVGTCFSKKVEMWMAQRNFIPGLRE